MLDAGLCVGNRGEFSCTGGQSVHNSTSGRQDWVSRHYCYHSLCLGIIVSFAITKYFISCLVSCFDTSSPFSSPLRLVWSLFVVFTILHLLANYRAVSVVSMETLNKSRLHLVMSTYLRTGRIPEVAWVNAREPVVLCK